MDLRKTASDQEIYQHQLEHLKNSTQDVSEFEKRVFLLSNGLYKLIETEPNEANAFRDSKDGKYWKKVPIQITDQEFLEIRAVQMKNQNIDYIPTPAATIIGIFVIGIGILIAAVLSTIPLFGVGMAIFVGVASVLFGVLYLSLGSIVTSINRMHQTIEKKD